MTRIRAWIGGILVIVALGLIGTWYVLQRGAGSMQRIMETLPEVAERLGQSGYRQLPPQSRGLVDDRPVAVIESLQQVGMSNVEGGPAFIYYGEWMSSTPDSLRSTSFHGEVVQDGLTGEPATIILRVGDLPDENPDRVALKIGRGGPVIPLRWARETEF